MGQFDFVSVRSGPLIRSELRDFSHHAILGLANGF